MPGYLGKTQISTGLYVWILILQDGLEIQGVNFQHASDKYQANKGNVHYILTFLNFNISKLNPVRGWQAFSVKGKIVNIFGFLVHTVSAANTDLSSFS